MFFWVAHGVATTTVAPGPGLCCGSVFRFVRACARLVWVLRLLLAVCCPLAGGCASWSFQYVLVNTFWSSLLQIAAQVLAPGVRDVASASTGRAALAVGRLSHPLVTKLVSFSKAAEPH